MREKKLLMKKGKQQTSYIDSGRRDGLKKNTKKKKKPASQGTREFWVLWQALKGETESWPHQVDHYWVKGGGINPGTCSSKRYKSDSTKERDMTSGKKNALGSPDCHWQKAAN